MFHRFHTGLARTSHFLPLHSAAQTQVTSPFWHRCAPKGVGSASPRGGGARFTLSCRLLSLGIAAVIEFCLAVCDWPCMRHRLNGLCYKYGLFHGLLLRSSRIRLA